MMIVGLAVSNRTLHLPKFPLSLEYTIITTNTYDAYAAISGTMRLADTFYLRITPFPARPLRQSVGAPDL